MATPAGDIRSNLASIDIPISSYCYSRRPPQPSSTLPPGKKAVDLCTDFLRLLNEYLLECLKSNYDRRLDLATTPFHYVLTTPADWSTEAQELTKQAAVAAGMGERQSDDTLSMTTEPLAAATCVLRYLVEEIPVTSQDLVSIL
jgi:hypothetical protein